MPVSFSLSSSSATTQPTSAYPSEYHPKGPCEVKAIRSFADDKYRAILDCRELRSDKAKLLTFLEGLTNDIIDLRIPSQGSLSKIKQLRGSFDKDGAGLAPALSSYDPNPVPVEHVRPPIANPSLKVASNDSSNSGSGNVRNNENPFNVHTASAAAEAACASPASPVRSSGSYSPKKSGSAASAAPLAAPPMSFSDEVDLSNSSWRGSGGAGKRPVAVVPPEENQRSLDLSDLTASRMEAIKRM